MKINLDDPNLTAYALGELSGEERAAMEKAVAESAEAEAFIRETQHMAARLEHEFSAELDQASAKPANILPLPSERSFWSDARWMSIGVAALLAVCAVIAAVALSGPRRDRVTSAEGKSQRLNLAPAADREDGDVQMEVISEPTIPAPPPLLAQKSEPSPEFFEEKPTESFNTAEYDPFEENPFLTAAANPLSTFSIDVDTASYANLRRMISSGTKPPKDAVRIEEMINYFAYDYPQPAGDEAFSINLEVAACPWQPDHRLVRIGLKGREIPADKRGASNLVFLLDVSGSMEPANRLPLVKQAMRLLVDKLTDEDRVAIVVYAGGSGLVLPSTTGDRKEQILAALEELKAGGSTNGAAGIELAYRIAAENFIPGGVNRVILATDGDFNVGATSQGELVRLAEEKAKSGVFLSVLGVGDDNLRDSTMMKLADRANGNYAYLDSLAEARKVLVQQMNGTLVTIAKDVKIQVEFNPARVASYRLLGYEKRMLRKEDFNNDKVDAGEIGAGHTVTALYEIVPAREGNGAAGAGPVDALKYQPNPTATGSSQSSPDLLTVKLRHKKPDADRSVVTERALVESGVSFDQASKDFQFAAAVAEFGIIVRGSPHKGTATMSAVLERAQASKGADQAGYRAGFIDLVRKAQSLAF